MFLNIVSYIYIHYNVWRLINNVQLIWAVSRPYHAWPKYFTLISEHNGIRLHNLDSHIECVKWSTYSLACMWKVRLFPAELVSWVEYGGSRWFWISPNIFALALPIKSSLEPRQ